MNYRSIPWITLLITSTAILSHMLLGGVPSELVFDKQAINNGEIWRWFTGHLVHSDLEHAIWDILVFALAGSFVEHIHRKQYLLILSISINLINLWLYIGEPDIQFYCGLSGMINTLLAFLLLDLIIKTKDPMIGLVFIGFSIKIILEANSGQALFTATAWPMLASVHATGFIIGTILFLTSTYSNRKPTPCTV